MKYLHDTILDLKKEKEEVKGRAHDLKNQDANYRVQRQVLTQGFFQFASNETKLVP